MATRASQRRLWKKGESTIALMLGGRRVPVTGRQRGDAPDVEHPYLAIEYKHRTVLPDWLREGMAQAKASAAEWIRTESARLRLPMHKTPIVIAHQKGQPYKNAYVVLELHEFQSILEMAGFMARPYERKLPEDETA